ncbi:hypothetical protein B0I35DRAFT_404200 [Stachybotrys elegans]|uniref:SWI5-dependent HO expression protein 3 n=1 Tax=Stachybotrys elegans TaxID=80388 RepID=A0A8K0T6B8_9HYPO|nr:hypothetical protein B0I35DRAFT_404200 [Stachybotrys elegans]
MSRPRRAKRHAIYDSPCPRAVTSDADTPGTADSLLTSASTGTMNGQPAADNRLSRPGATIRTVPSFDGSASSPESKHSGFSNGAASDLTASSTMGALQQEPDQATTLRRKPGSVGEMTTKWNATGVRAIEPSSSQGSLQIPQMSEQQDEWDSTVGKAGLGKTGRVINKLVSDNDALKRDIKIERLLAEEAKQSAKLVEDKMERMISEYESRLLEANVTKTLLSRKERQVETLTSLVEAERKKTQIAEDRERNWRQELEKTRSESTIQVEEATTHAALMEGRYNAISSHWRDQGKQVKRALSEMEGEIISLVMERKKDDEKIQTLRDLCDQQHTNVKQLTDEKEQIARLFEEYKATQEEALRDIKTKAKQREEEQERLLAESREALAKLKWALNVKNNVKGAQ